MSDEPRQADRSAGRPSPRALVGGMAAAFAISLILYAATASRGPQWQDSGTHLLRIIEGELENPRGLALVHPLHYWLGRLALGVRGIEAAFAVTLISSFGAAVTIAGVFGCVFTLTRDRLAAGWAAGSLMVAHTFWQLSTLVEIYTLTTALLAFEMWLLAAYAIWRRPALLCLALAANGISLGNHLQALLTLPVLAAVMIIEWRRQNVSRWYVAIAGVLWLAGSLPFTGLVIAEWLKTGDPAGTIRSALFGKYYAEDVLNVGLSGRTLAIVVGFPLYNFPSLVLPAALYGLGSARRIAVPALFRRAITAALVIHVVFVIRYTVPDQHTFFLPCYVLMAILAGMGLAAVRQRWEPPWRERVLGIAIVAAACTPLWYAIVPRVARHYGALDRIVHNKPYRDDYAYLLVPWTVAERSAERVTRHALELAGDRGVIVVEDSIATDTVKYAAWRAGRGDLPIITVPPAKRTDLKQKLDETIVDAARSGVPVVLVPLNADAPRYEAALGEWSRCGDLYVLAAPSTTQAH